MICRDDMGLGAELQTAHKSSTDMSINRQDSANDCNNGYEHASH